MKQYILGLGIITSAFLLTTQLLWAQDQSGENCAAYEIVIAQLADKYGERRQSIGLSGSGQVVEMFASPETGSWTIIVTRPSGISCLIAAGQNFERVDEALAPMIPGMPA